MQMNTRFSRPSLLPAGSNLKHYASRCQDKPSTIRAQFLIKRRTTVKIRQLSKMTVGAVVALEAIVLAGMINTPPPVQAQDNGNNDEEHLVHIGFPIAPCPLDSEGENRD